MRIILSAVAGCFLFIFLLAILDGPNNTLKVSIFFGVIILSVLCYFFYDNFFKHKKANIINSSEENIEIFENKGKDLSENLKEKHSPFFNTFLLILLAFVLSYVVIILPVAFLMGSH